MKLIQQTANCSDFDVVLDTDMPAFRVLLPEHVASHMEVIHTGHAHTIRGAWRQIADGCGGLFRIEERVEVSVQIFAERGGIAIVLTLRNLTPDPLRHVTVNVCASVNHLPGAPPWCNRQFLPDVPIERFEQGRYWYEVVTPNGLRALTRRGWRLMHPTPQNPSAANIDPYTFLPSAAPEAFACAAQSHDGRKLFFQAWDVPCYYAAPFCGNACMHLHPLVAEVLESGASATIHGHVGIFEGGWEDLAGIHPSCIKRERF